MFNNYSVFITDRDTFAIDRDEIYIVFGALPITGSMRAARITIFLARPIDKKQLFTTLTRSIPYVIGRV